MTGLQFLIIFSATFLLCFDAIVAVKPYFSVCNPSLGSAECGENAVCFASSRCQFGRCLCISDEYRPFKMDTRNDPVYGSDCARVLRLDENCTDLNAHLVNTEAGQTCIEGVVACAPPHFERVGGKCVFSSELKSKDVDCHENATCNSHLGLVCVNDTVAQSCRCPPFQRFFIDRRYPFGGRCDFPGYHDRCDGDDQCSGFSSASVGGPLSLISVCRGPPFICKCNEPLYTPLNYFIAWENNTWNMPKTFCVPNMPVKADLGGSCWISPPLLNDNGRVVAQQPIICNEGLVCFSCPEFAPSITPTVVNGGLPLPGRCVNMEPNTSDDASAVSASVAIHLTSLLVCLIVSSRAIK